MGIPSTSVTAPAVTEISPVYMSFLSHDTNDKPTISRIFSACFIFGLEKMTGVQMVDSSCIHASESLPQYLFHWLPLRQLINQFIHVADLLHELILDILNTISANYTGDL